MMVSFSAVLFPRDVLDEILDLIESVSGGGGGAGVCVCGGGRGFLPTQYLKHVILKYVEN